MDSESSDPGYRSRSQSRRARRRKTNQQQSSQAQAQSKQSLPAVDEESQQQQQQQQQEASSSANAENTMQPFEFIGPDSTSMDGPVTYARAQRGEIPMRPGNPNQQLKTGPQGGKEESKMMEQDGLKLRLELNLDVEIELKATIKGDLTLALL